MVVRSPVHTYPHASSWVPGFLQRWKKRPGQCVREAEPKQGTQCCLRWQNQRGREKSEHIQAIVMKPLQCRVSWCHCQGRQTHSANSHEPAAHGHPEEEAVEAFPGPCWPASCALPLLSLPKWKVDLGSVGHIAKFVHVVFTSPLFSWFAFTVNVTT